LQFDQFLQNRLDQNFYSQKVTTVAKKLLGKHLLLNRNGIIQIGQITETESYGGLNDLASHARYGPTPRNQIMWGPPGRLYIYLVYGLHHLLNITTEPEGQPSGVLIRSLLPILNLPENLNGPAKITKALNLTTTDTNTDITKSKQIFIYDANIKPKKIISTPRIGINYAPEPWRSIPWRTTGIF
jgi:DNA-3-methyladenine glycosylase